MTMQAERSSRSSQSTQVDVQVEAMDTQDIRSIQLATGWEQVSGALLTQFAVGKAHSPISPTKVYPTLSYENREGKRVFTPLSQILSFSTEQISDL